MRALRLRIRRASSSGEAPSAAHEPWRATVESCVVKAGDDDNTFDLGALRRDVLAEGATLSTDAAATAEIIEQWQRSGDDKTFAMRTRFFPAGVKIPGVKWT